MLYTVALVILILMMVLFRYIGKKFTVFQKAYLKIYKKLFFNGLTRYIV